MEIVRWRNDRRLGKSPIYEVAQRLISFAGLSPVLTTYMAQIEASNRYNNPTYWIAINKSINLQSLAC